MGLLQGLFSNTTATDKKYIFEQFLHDASKISITGIYDRIEFAFLYGLNQDLPAQLREEIIINACSDGNELARGRDDKYQYSCGQMSEEVDFLRLICLRAPDSLMQHKIYLEHIVRELSEGSHDNLLKLARGTSHNPLFNTNKTIDELVKTDGIYTHFADMIAYPNQVLSFDISVSEILDNTKDEATRLKVAKYFEDTLFENISANYSRHAEKLQELPFIHAGNAIQRKNPYIIAAITNVMVRSYNDPNLSNDDAYDMLEAAVHTINIGAKKHSSLKPLRDETNILFLAKNQNLEIESARELLQIVGPFSASRAFLRAVQNSKTAIMIKGLYAVKNEPLEELAVIRALLPKREL